MNTTRRSVVAAAAVMIAGLYTFPAAAQPTKDDQKCLSAVSSAVQQFTQKKLKALAKCRAVANPSGTVCPDDKASGAIAAAAGKMASKIDKKCGEKFDAGRALGYTGCTTPGCTSAADYNACIKCAAPEVTDQIVRTSSDGACGNGSIEAGEKCDDGAGNSDTTPDACRTACVPSGCGDDVADSGEECDGTDDAACSGRACLDDCTCTPAPAVCGDDEVNRPEEECDGTDDAACSGSCYPPGDPNECKCPSCGDDVKGPDEECDGTDDDTCPGLCREDCTCTPVGCGDNVKDPDEECDGTDDDACPGRCGEDCSCVCDCCTTGLDLLSFETGIASGNCGTRKNFRCSNNANATCTPGVSTCTFGTCFDFGAPFGKRCTGDFTVSCTSDTTCQVGTCNQVGNTNDLVCGGLYTGGGANSVPLPLPIPDQGLSFTKVTVCQSTGSGTLTLAATAPVDLAGKVSGCTSGSEEECRRHCTKGRTCSGSGANCVVDGDCPLTQTCVDNCLFGPPLPIPNSNNTPTSVCVVNVPERDASGTAQCDGGDSDLSLPLRSVIYLTGDILSASAGPLNVPGIQSCALCSPQCVGGSSANQPCQDDSECPGSTCDGTPNCIGGIDHGNACAPGSSAINAGFPTSHDCRVSASLNITSNIGGLPVDFALTSGAASLQAVDQPTQRRVFCGFCRDVNIEGSNCFDGNPDPGQTKGCPDSVAQPTCLPTSGSTAGCGEGVPCNDDSDCTAPYESCSQTTSGGFSDAASTVIDVQGSTDAGCLADGAPHTAKLVSAFCIPPTFDPTVDAAGDLPGPGAAMLQGDAQLQ